MKYIGFKQKGKPILDTSSFRKLFNLDHVSVPLDVLNSIIDRALEHPYTEEGGVLVGYFEDAVWEHYGTYNDSVPSLNIVNFIPSGPRTVRTSSSLHSDLEFQEYEFDRLRDLDPRIEHLGSWHSHHCNGLKELSHGDLRSYYNIVESPNHSHNYYVAILLHSIPKRHLACEQDVFQAFRFYIISRETGKRSFTLDKTCIEVTRSPILYSEFINSGYNLPDELHRREIMAGSWFKGWDAKEIIKCDNHIFDKFVRNNPHLQQGNISVSEGVHGFGLIRRFHLKSMTVEYHYPESKSEEGIRIRVYSNNLDSIAPNFDTLDVRIRPLEIRHHIFAAVLECLGV